MDFKPLDVTSKKKKVTNSKELKALKVIMEKLTRLRKNEPSSY